MDLQEYIAKQVQVVLKDYLDNLETTMYVYGTMVPRLFALYVIQGRVSGI